MLNNIETAILKIKITSLKKEVKIQTKLLKGSTLLGSADFFIPASSLQKREESIKKWLNINRCTINNSASNKKINFALSLISSIRLNLKAVLNYSEMKPENNSDWSGMNVSNTINNSGNISSTVINTRKNSLNNFGYIYENFKKEEPTKTENIKNKNSKALNGTPNTHTNFSNNKENPTFKRKMNTRIKNLSCSNITNLPNLASPIASKNKAKCTTTNYSNNKSIKQNINDGQIYTTRSEMHNNKSFSKQNSYNDLNLIDKQEEFYKVVETEVVSSNARRNLKFDKVEPKEEKNNVDIKIEENKDKEVNNINVMNKEEIKVIDEEMNVPDDPLNLENKEYCLGKEKENDCEQQSETSSDNSFIDSFFMEDYTLKDENNEYFLKLYSNNFNNSLNEFKSYYNDNFLSILPDDATYLKFEIKMLIEKGLELQENYYDELKELMMNNKSFKNFLLLYNEKYRQIFKKLNRLKEQIESNRIKQTLSSFVHKQDSIRIKDNLELMKKEINLHKKVLKINYNEVEVKEFSKNKKSIYEKDKKTLFKIAENIFSNEQLKEKLDEEQLMILYRIINENKDPSQINENPAEPTHKEVQEMPGTKRNVASKDKSKMVDPVRNNNEMKYVSRDEKINLDNKLKEVLSKKNIPIIEFKKITEGIYEFDSQKIIVTLENKGEIKGNYKILMLVNSGNKTQRFEEFIESALKTKLTKKEADKKNKKHIRNNSISTSNVNSLDSAYYKKILNQKNNKQ